MMQDNKENAPTLRRTSRKTKKPTCECDTYSWKKKKSVPRKKKRARRPRQQPLEFANANEKSKFFSHLRRYRRILPNGHVDVDSDSSGEEPETPSPRYSASNLPLMTFFGPKKKLEDINQKELRTIIPKLCKIVNGRRAYWGKQHLKPKWWPKDVPFDNVKRDMRSWTARDKTSWTEALRRVIRFCYRYYGQEYKIGRVKSGSNNNGNAIVTQSANLNAAHVTDEVTSISPPSTVISNSEMQSFIANGSLCFPNFYQELPLDIFAGVDDNVNFNQALGQPELQLSDVYEGEVQNTPVPVDMDSPDICSMVNEFSTDLNSGSFAELTNYFTSDEVPLWSSTLYDDTPSFQDSIALIENDELTESWASFLEFHNLEQLPSALFSNDYSDTFPAATDTGYNNLTML